MYTYIDAWIHRYIHTSIHPYIHTLIYIYAYDLLHSSTFILYLEHPDMELYPPNKAMGYTVCLLDLYVFGVPFCGYLIYLYVYWFVGIRRYI